MLMLRLSLCSNLQKEGMIGELLQYAKSKFVSQCMSMFSAQLQSSVSEQSNVEPAPLSRGNFLCIVFTNN